METLTCVLDSLPHVMCTETDIFNNRGLKITLSSFNENCGRIRSPGSDVNEIKIKLKVTILLF